MGFLKKKKKERVQQSLSNEVQMRYGESHPFSVLETYVPLGSPAFGLYRAIREAVPVVDAAMMKLVRLAGGVKVSCEDALVEKELNIFLETVPTGWKQRGIQSFLDAYLDEVLTCGRAVGEIVLCGGELDIGAVLVGDVSQISIESTSPLDMKFYRENGSFERKELPYQNLILFTTHRPSVEAPYGTSLLHSLPFMSNILMKIFQTLGSNWERAGNLRYSVVYKPEDDSVGAEDRGAQLASEWSHAMQSTKSGAVRDFVAVGDVEIKVIGSEATIPDCQVPVKLILEQLVTQLGIPPFLLGLNWTSTERMSTQQADMMTSEITALRRMLEPILAQICDIWMRIHGYAQKIDILWEDINLQDAVDEAQAALYREQARALQRENDSLEVEG